MAAVQPLLHPTYVRSDELGREITELCGYIHADTCSSNWSGEKMDHDIAVGIIWDIDMPDWQSPQRY